MRFLSFILLALLIGGCASSGNLHRYTQSQITAITTRTVDAGVDETFRAATSALFDAGYTVSVSDRDAGIVSGYKRDSKAAERFWISSYIEDTDFRISVMIAEDGYDRTRARVSMSRNGEQVINEEAVDQLWALMRRQVLIQEPVTVTEQGS